MLNASGLVRNEKYVKYKKKKIKKERQIKLN